MRRSSSPRHAALTVGTPLVLALTPATHPVGLAAEAVPAALRHLEMGSGVAADYDAWLQGGAA